MIACALLAVGCSGRNAAFGVVDIKKVEAEAPAVKAIKEDLQKKAKELQEQPSTKPEADGVMGLSSTIGLPTTHLLLNWLIPTFPYASVTEAETEPSTGLTTDGS